MSAALPLGMNDGRARLRALGGSRTSLGDASTLGGGLRCWRSSSSSSSVCIGMSTWWVVSFPLVTSIASGSLSPTPSTPPPPPSLTRVLSSDTVLEPPPIDGLNIFATVCVIASVVSTSLVLPLPPPPPPDSLGSSKSGGGSRPCWSIRSLSAAAGCEFHASEISNWLL
uniref:(northern house mosquito) hypothetical protein n=1 Tax=Culex pipiens TaxID=7175 RepID=A0A8D8GYF5_CULPI